MTRSILVSAMALLAVPALAQTTPPDDTAPPATAASETRQAIIDDAPTTPRSGETDVGATRASTLPAGSRAYPRCSATVTDSCIQSSRRRTRR